MAKALAAGGFDYQQIEDADVRGKLIYFAGTIKQRRDGAVSLVLEIGRDLLSVQSLLANHKNGTFQRWLADEFDLSKTSAYRMMAASSVFGDDILSHGGTISDSAMYALSADTCQEAATEEAKKLAKQGVFVTHKLANELIDKYTLPAESEPEAVEEPEPEPEPEISGEAKELLRRAKIEPKPKHLAGLAAYDETSQVLLADSVAKGVQTLDEAIETGHVAELWEELAAVHNRAIKVINEVLREFKAIAEDEERGGYIQHVITRIKTDLEQVKATIRQSTPVGSRGGKIVTKADEQRGK